MEEKLKTFGELLKETVELRKDEPVSDSSITLSDAERNAILEKIADRTETPAQPPSAGASGTEDSSTVPFGVLLEKTIKIRSEMDEADISKDDEIREAVISKSKIDMVEQIMKGLRL